MRRTYLLAVLVAFFALAGWWMFFISPRNADISDLENELTTAQTEELRLRGQVADLKAIRDREVEYLAAIGQLETLVPDRPLLEEFIEELNGLAVSTGVTLQTLSPGFPVLTDDTNLREIAVSVQLEGEFFEVMGLLFGLSDMQRLVRVDGIALASSVDAEGATQLAVSLDVRLFTLADLIPTLVEPDAGTDDGPDGAAPDTSTSGDEEV